MTQVSIPGYRMGDATLPASSVGAQDLDRLLQSVLFTDEDQIALREAKAIVGDRVEEILDVWYGFVGSHDFLLATFATPDGPHGEYLARVRARFGPVGAGHAGRGLRRPLAALSGGDRPPAHGRQEPDGRRLRCPGDRALPLPRCTHLPHLRHHAPLPGSRRTRRGAPGADAPGLAEGGDPLRVLWSEPYVRPDWF